MSEEHALKNNYPIEAKDTELSRVPFVLRKAMYDCPWQYAVVLTDGNKYFFDEAEITSKDYVMLKLKRKTLEENMVAGLSLRGMGMIPVDVERGLEVRIDSIVMLIDTPLGS